MKCHSNRITCTNIISIKVGIKYTKIYVRKDVINLEFLSQGYCFETNNCLFKYALKCVLFHFPNKFSALADRLLIYEINYF